MYAHLKREYSLEDIAAFHGHLGPFLVLGYRMGRYARLKLCDDPFALRARLFCSGSPPETCIADGLQLGSGCTLGKTNIEIIHSPEIRCEFEANGQKIVFTPNPYDIPPRDAQYDIRIEQVAVDLFGRPDEELFTVEGD